ncbi:MAG: DUF4329 domain-containing protein [Bryobacterales bacterium]|nr:DUF4329 domain-containing protein [Bryobacterales bacterium]
MQFRTANEAAIHILRVINPRSIIENFEYAGLIYRTSQGYNYTIPHRGNTDWDRGNADLDWIRIPPNAVEVGHYHTHGDYTFRGPWDATLGCHHDRRARGTGELTREATPFGVRMFIGDYFSPVDLSTTRARGRGVSGYRAYLGTPSGVLYYWDPPNSPNQVVLARGVRPVIPANILPREAAEPRCARR